MASPTPIAALTAASQAGPGPTVDFTTAVKNVSMVLVPNLVVDGGVVLLQASHDGTNWVTMNGLTPTSEVGITFCTVSTGAFRYWRANITAEITGGGNIDGSLMEAG